VRNFFGATVERDQTINKLESDLLKKIKEICPPEAPPNSVKVNETRFVGFEDAIKELIAMSKQ